MNDTRMSPYLRWAYRMHGDRLLEMPASTPRKPLWTHTWHATVVLTHYDAMGWRWGVCYGPALRGSVTAWLDTRPGFYMHIPGTLNNVEMVVPERVTGPI